MIYGCLQHGLFVSFRGSYRVTYNSDIKNVRAELFYFYGNTLMLSKIFSSHRCPHSLDSVVLTSLIHFC